MDPRLINDTFLGEIGCLFELFSQPFTLDNMRSNLINVRSGIREYSWEKIQKLINVRSMFIPDPRVEVDIRFYLAKFVAMEHDVFVS